MERKEYTVSEYIKKVKEQGVSSEELKKDSYWKENPNHRVIYCAEGMPCSVKVD